MATEKIPRRNFPKFKITKEKAEEIRAISAITKIFADDSELTQKIADVFVQASRADPKDRMATQIELRETVSEMVAERLKAVPAERVAELFPFWQWHIIDIWYPHTTIPHIHIWNLWGPYIERGTYFER